MFGRTFFKVKELYNKEIDGTGLAVFRIVYSLVLLGEVLHIFYYRHLIFDKIPYLVPGEIDMWPILLFWVVSIVLLVFGLFTRVAALVNYIVTVALLGTISSFEYHMFYSYLAINFLLIFLPVSRCLSVDRLLTKLKYSNTRFQYNPPKTVSVLGYFVPLLMGIAFVYFDSVFFKFASDFWIHGLGLWLPASMPQAVFIDTSFLLNNRLLVIGLGYLTLVFEAVFLFTFWLKKFRVPLMVIGVGLHIGILVCFPIPFFALGITALYILMIPVSLWHKWFSIRADKKAYVLFFYDAECPLCNRTRIIINHLDVGRRVEFRPVQSAYEQEESLAAIPYASLLSDVYSVDLGGTLRNGVDTYIRVCSAIWYLKPLSWILRLPGIYHLFKRIYQFVAVNRTAERCTEANCGYTPPVVPVEASKVKILNNLVLSDVKILCVCVGLGLLLLFQVIVTYDSPLVRNAQIALGIENSRVIKFTKGVANRVRLVTKVFFGINHHGLFMDYHFAGYNHSIAVLYKTDNGKQVWLPITDPDGTPGNYQFGHNWAKWTFRANSPLIDHERLSTSIRDFTAFWAYKNNVNLEDAVFEIKVKKNEVPTHWEKDFLTRQLQNPWLDAGKIIWKDKQFRSEIVDIEAL